MAAAQGHYIVPTDKRFRYHDAHRHREGGKGIAALTRPAISLNRPQFLHFTSVNVENLCGKKAGPVLTFALLTLKNGALRMGREYIL
ncbi:hypothetical protein [Noviherbaspirillum humi]|uniref:hypothetical protein n=1 Tax=Noviherbaspirillum humi TaxID=1688639 RepID=UPI00116070DF|nr:hypothetical protein [Noviherbaspirillum humi]